MIKQIYLDMDGVLVDTHSAIEKVGLKPFKGMWNNDEFWARIKEFGSDFWANADPYPWASQLVEASYDAVGQANTFILTAPSRTCFPAATGKMQWLHKHFPEFIHDSRMLIASKKYLLARPDRFLIDDRASVVSEWNKAGGDVCHFHPERGQECVNYLAHFLRTGGRPDLSPVGVQSSRGLSYHLDQDQKKD